MIITNEKDAIDFLKKHTTAEQFQKLLSYQSLLIEVNKHTNLISRNTEDQIFYRHILDSFQLLQYINPKKKVLDIGTGAGLPGIVLSIMGIDVVMIDSNNKKIKFVHKIIDSLDLNAKVQQCRIEESNITTDILTARALKPLHQILKMVYQNIVVKDKMLLLKGINLNKEIIEAQKQFEFKYDLLPSITSSESNIIEVYN